MIEIYTLDDTKMILDKGFYTTLPDFSIVEQNGGKGVKMDIKGGHYIALPSLGVV
ncbi:hypothetical protein FACS189440_20550 [Bacteroidia bacterium]|nr:hypothetical protein FACS189440_20550 [Bacteroidia bacterium]